MSIDDLKEIPECIVICNDDFELESLLSVCLGHTKIDERIRKRVIDRCHIECKDDGIGIRMEFGSFECLNNAAWYFKQGRYKIFYYEEIFETQQSQPLMQFEDLFEDLS